MLIIQNQELSKKPKGTFLAEGSREAAGEEIGFAVDIGTTAVSVTAVSLTSKRELGTIVRTNEQRQLGADVMMRLMHCQAGKQDKLHQMIIQQVEDMAETLWRETTSDAVPAAQTAFFVVGNPTMCHIFLNESVEGLLGYPFHAAYEGNRRCKGKEIGMERFGEAEICVLSGIASHVGADALAVIGACRLYAPDRVQLAVDLGTNAEMILNVRGTLFACSAASGPAFEGKGTTCGMMAKTGAVSGVTIARGNGNLILRVICGGTVKGICSSGFVDLLAQLLKCGLIDRSGYLLTRQEAEGRGILRAISERLCIRKGERAFLLCTAQENGQEIVLLQSDIHSLQLAKAAIQAGVRILLEQASKTIGEMDELVTAGTLGSSVRKSSAVSIGLVPKEASDKLVLAGNAAGTGAILGLTDKNFAGRMEKLAREITHVELAEYPDFQNMLMQAIDLKEWL